MAALLVPRDRLVVLDGMRGVFALLVLAYHYTTWFALPVGSFVYGLLDRSSIYAVCGFFALSGASMAISYRSFPPTTPRLFARYLVRRFFRIAPLFYAVLALHIAGRAARCVSGGVCETDFVADLLANLTFTFGFGRAAENSMVVAGWSIGIEWVFYLLFPVMILVMARSVVWALGLVALLGACLLAWDAWFMGLPNPTWSTYAQFPAYAVYFGIGVLIGTHRILTVFQTAVVLAALAVVYVLANALLPTFSPDTGAAGPVAWFFGCVTGGAVAVGAWGRQPSGSAKYVNALAGDLSYAVYLLHFPVSVAIAKLGLYSWLGAFVGAALTLAAAYAIHRWLELPFVKLGKQLSDTLGSRSVSSGVGPN